MPDFRFNPETHTYYLDGEVIPSVTQVLPYNYDPENTFPMEKGTAVHRMCYLNNIGKSDKEIMLDPDLMPWFLTEDFMGYLEANKRFRDENELSGCYDYKTGSPYATTPIQMAGYDLLKREGEVATRTVALKAPAFEIMLYHPSYLFAGTLDILASGKGSSAVYLRPNGTYKLENYTKELRKNRNIFLSFLTTHKWRLENGV